VLSRSYNWINNPALIGLGITYSFSVSMMLSFTLRIATDVENNMNSVSRMLDYIDKNPQEKDFDDPTPPATWPSEGNYKLENITYRYRPELEDVIHGITFSINNCEKIGVVGRTGSGKSTLTLGLLRILELALSENGQKGSITLNNLNIENIGLHHLRSNVTIIP